MFAHNRDDHSRNFAFLMDEQGNWRPSPAYDLTWSQGPGGEHTMLVTGEGRAPGPAHLTNLAAELEVRHAAQILREVRAAVSRFKHFADKAHVPPRLRDTTAKVIAPATR